MHVSSLTSNFSKKLTFRKNLLIYPKFQLLLIGCNIAIVSLGFLAVGMGLHHFFEQLQSRGVDSGLSPGHYYFIFLGNESHHLYGLVGAAYALSILVSSAITLFLSQKIAGPIVRLKAYFEGVENAKSLPTLQFRKGDFFDELPQTINAALKKLR